MMNQIIPRIFGIDITMNPVALILAIIVGVIVYIAFRNLIISLLKVAIGAGTIYFVIKAILYIAENTSIVF